MIKRSLIDARVQLLKTTVEEVVASEYDSVSVAVCLKRVNDLSTQYVELQEAIVDECENEQHRKDIVDHQITFDEITSNMRTALLKIDNRFRGAAEEKTSEQNEGNEQNGAGAIKLLAEQQTELLRLLSCSFNPHAESTSVADTTPRIDVRLPRMNLPTFDGDILKWASFYDLFETAIHQNASLHNAQRLYFLKTNLTGEAAALISHLKIEDGNYEPALEKLKQRYEKPLEAAVKHIDRFIKQPAIIKP